jgi:hypothetical protein
MVVLPKPKLLKVEVKWVNAKEVACNYEKR